MKMKSSDPMQQQEKNIFHNKKNSCTNSELLFLHQADGDLLIQCGIDLKNEIIDTQFGFLLTAKERKN